MSELKIRPIHPKDFVELMQWMNAENWIVNLNTVEATLLWDQDGWLVAERDDQLVGSIACCVVGPNLAAGGYFIVRKDQRRQGVGKKLWEARLRYLAGRNLGINAVENRVEPNRAKGLVHCTFEMATFTGLVNKELLSLDIYSGLDITRYQPTADLDALVKYDSSHHLFKRHAFLEHYLRPEITSTIVARRDGGIVGYGSIQPVEMGLYHVGPVFAEEDQIGIILLNYLFDMVPDGKEVTLDVPLENKITMHITEQHNLQQSLECVRMYNKVPVTLEMQKIYAMTTLGVSII